MDATEALALANRLSKQLAARRPEIKKRLDYYRGEHKLRFASQEFETHFRERFKKFSDNWCSAVLEAPSERMNVLGIRLDETQRDADNDLARVMAVNNADRGWSESFLVTMAASRSFVLVWGNPDDEQTPRVTWEHPANCIVAYNADTGQRTAGLKEWEDDEGAYRTLYTADEVWKWRKPKSSSGLILPNGFVTWTPRQPASDDEWPIPNPMGVVPLVEQRNQTVLDDVPLSDIDGVASMQDAVNLVWAYLFNALDFASLPQRIVTGADIPGVPVLDDNGQVVGTRKLDLKELMQHRILWLTEDAKPSSWPAAQLDVFGAVIEKAVEHIAAQTRTPPHYLIGKIVNASGEALTVAETGLVAKTVQRQGFYEPTIREVFRLVALAQGQDSKAQAAASGKVLWADPQYRSMAQKVDAFQKLRASGLPLEYLLEWYGLPPQEVQRVLDMARAESTDLLGGNLAALVAGPKPAPPEATDLNV